MRLGVKQHILGSATIKHIYSNDITTSLVKYQSTLRTRSESEKDIVHSARLKYFRSTLYKIINFAIVKCYRIQTN